MSTAKVYPLSQHLGSLCCTHRTNVHKLGWALGIDPSELLRMFNAREPMPEDVVAGLAKVLDSDVSYLEKLAQEVRQDLNQAESAHPEG